MAQEATKPAKRSSPVKNGYLILYNAVSAVLWATVLGRTVGTNILRGPGFVHFTTGEFVLWTQTLMIMDVLHALFGMFLNWRLTGPFSSIGIPCNST
jgi:very-long-chain (3R)-3-hydroxyacyl-CoA dehydratase